MLKWFTSRFSNKNILVEVDPKLVTAINRNNHDFTALSPNNTLTIRINMNKLIRAVFTIQTRRYRPTWFQKLTGKSDLLDFVKTSDDFCIIKHFDPDKQTGLSEDFGVGLSVLITDYLFRIDWNTLTKEPRGRHPSYDINCISHFNESLAVEAKGTTHKGSRSKQKNRARTQKNNSQANVKIASCALLKEHSISDVDFFDPPIISPEDERYKKSIMKADHYTRVFNLIGQKELSKYFNLMRKRIINNKEFPEYKLKEKLYAKIKTNYIRISVGGHYYYGNIEKFNDFFIFTGLDRQLLSVNDFIHFEGYEGQYVKEGENEFQILSDGLCIALLKNIEFLENQISPEEIPHHFDYFSVIDFDYSEQSTIVDYLSYLFEKNGCEIQKQDSKRDQGFDLLIKCEDKLIAIQIKRYLNTKKMDPILERLSAYSSNQRYRTLLVTNRNLNQEILQTFRSRNIQVIDRAALYEITADHKKLLDYLG